MTEEFPDPNSFFMYPKNHFHHRPENVTIKTHKIKEPPQNRVEQIIYTDQRQFETEKFTQKSLPNLKQSYGSIYANEEKSPPYHISESEPLLSKHRPGYLHHIGIGEPVHSRYRRTQIFLYVNEKQNIFSAIIEKGVNIKMFIC